MMEQRRENLVFVGQDEQKLRFAPSAEHPIRLVGPQTDPVEYIEEKDYVVDYSKGTISRTSSSRIPDWREHPSYGLDPFDHREFSSYTNNLFTCEVEYTAWTGKSFVNAPPLMKQKLPQLYKKLLLAEPIHYAVYGDSISAGYEASRHELDYPERFADNIRRKHPAADVIVHRKALGGESSRGGLLRLADDLLPIKPDLVTIGYGMNDQTRQPDGSNALPVDEFERNLLEMVRQIRAHSEADVILITPCLPNPKWIFASSNVTDYADAIRRIGREANIPVADVQRIWMQELAAGKSHESLLLNNLNHPNDYGHGLYFSALLPFLTTEEEDETAWK